MKISKRLGMASIVLMLTLGVSGQSKAESITFTHTFNGKETSGSSRLNRNGVASVAGTAKVFPGTVPSDPTYFTTLDVLNVAPGTVFSVSITSEDTFTFLSIYDNSFDSTSLSTNYLGDAGMSAPEVFSVTAPADGHLVVVANSIDGAGHGFSADVTFTPSTVPEPSSLALCGIAGVVGLVVARRRRKRTA
jgi:PEP-CTERM motif